MRVMKLDFAYPKELRTALEQTSPMTHRSIRLYKGSAQYYKDCHEGNGYAALFARIHWFPEPEFDKVAKLDDLIGDFIFPLTAGFSEEREVIIRTLKAHQSKKGDNLFNDPLAYVIASCAPHFLLETRSTNPRLPLFKLKGQEIHHYLPLPSKAAYEKQLW